MRLYKKKNKTLIYLLSIFLIFFGLLLYITPGLKGDIEKSLKIALNQPILFKTKLNTNSQLNLDYSDYSKKLFYAFKNFLTTNNDFPSIKIDIKFLELKKLKTDRKKALFYKKLFDPQKINITILFNNKKYKATARLKGDLSEHWGNHKQWSLRIKLKNKKTILSMNEFSLSVFEERAFPYNFVISEVLRENNILTPRYKIIKTSVNGENWGLMLLEEQFSESFYAFNKLKEAPVFKMTNENDFLIYTLAANKLKNISDIIRWQGKLETKIYNEKNILKKTNIPFKKTNYNLTSIFKNFQEVAFLNDLKYQKNLKDHLDVKLFARILAILSAFGDYHSHKTTNARYYLNPYDLKIVPILTDSTPSNISNENDIKGYIKGFGSFYKILYKDEKFRAEYFQTLNKLQDNFSEIEKKFIKVCKPFGENCKSLVDLETIKKNIISLKKKSNIFDDLGYVQEDVSNDKKFNTKNNLGLNKKKINFRIFDNGKIFIDNLTSEFLKINSAELIENKKCKKKCQSKEIELKYKIKPSTFKDLSSAKLNIEINKEDMQKYQYLKIFYLDEENKKNHLTEKIEKSEYEKKFFFSDTEISLSENIEVVGKNYILSQGEHVINKPIIIPHGYNFLINEGTTMKMSPNTYIMVKNGVVRFNGSKEKPIKITSIKKNLKWNGIYVNSDFKQSDKSTFDYVFISNFTYFDNTKIQLTGGINFINANVRLFHSTILNSYSEDAINFVNSKFNVDSIVVDNSVSDGIDIDFSRGSITQSKFKNTGGDAIDFSGSVATIKNIKIENVKDKAISVGEKTKLNAENLNISGAKIAVASKDSSEVNITNVSISDCGIFDYAAYQKKSYFSGSFMKVNNSKSCKKPFSQVGSELIVNERKIIEKKMNIKTI